MSLRGKSDLQDYRFMAEHDLPSLKLYSHAHPPPNKEGLFINIDEVAEEMVELPSQQRAKLVKKYSKYCIIHVVQLNCPWNLLA